MGIYTSLTMIACFVPAVFYVSKRIIKWIGQYEIKKIIDEKKFNKNKYLNKYDLENQYIKFTKNKAFQLKNIPIVVENEKITFDITSKVMLIRIIVEDILQISNDLKNTHRQFILEKRNNLWDILYDGLLIIEEHNDNKIDLLNISIFCRESIFLIEGFFERIYINKNQFIIERFLNTMKSTLCSSPNTFLQNSEKVDEIRENLKNIKNSSIETIIIIQRFFQLIAYNHWKIYND